MTTNLETPTIPTAEQINQTKQAIDGYIGSLFNHPDRRIGAFPYYKFHEPGEAIRGTIMLFHGFSGKPHQLWRLADYLFNNGFNFYQVTLVGHSLIPPDKYWPQIDLKSEYIDPMRKKVRKDQVLQKFISNITSSDTGVTQELKPFQRVALLSRLLIIEPRLLDMKAAIERDDDPDFDRYYISSHLNYLYDARERLNELAAMPGPIYTAGLSVGGAAALALAADRPDRVKKVVAYAPLLRVYDETKRKYVNLAGPLDIKEFSWEQGLSFPVGCFTAVDRFGSVVSSADSIKVLQNIPTFFVLTENEDAADTKFSEQTYKNMGGETKGHCCYIYPESDLVPHPLADPETVSQGMTNQFWQSLYQETFRFLTTGKVEYSNMSNLDQSTDLPTVPQMQ
ncbi:MAG: alpha/beta hydrolase [Symploca sp. SIO3C6]|uniref:Alpha/beta hydrolase n=1 Tax=Symploca sp. SIO1C4 TaxID=2607765 RepID=A0A6B3MYK9_9CYAN|nr:alpha/beta hydrolase [Symploca sp. SIO3C6]NER26506.1 alpha/beta hydrolase [Symploca sp. SIO1C4]